MNTSAKISSSKKQPSNNPKYLFLSRHGIYYARLVVPPELRANVGRCELRPYRREYIDSTKRSLGGIGQGELKLLKKSASK